MQLLCQQFSPAPGMHMIGSDPGTLQGLWDRSALHTLSWLPLRSARDPASRAGQPETPSAAGAGATSAAARAAADAALLGRRCADPGLGDSCGSGATALARGDDDGDGAAGGGAAGLPARGCCGSGRAGRWWSGADLERSGETGTTLEPPLERSRKEGILASPEAAAAGLLRLGRRCSCWLASSTGSGSCGGLSMTCEQVECAKALWSSDLPCVARRPVRQPQGRGRRQGGEARTCPTLATELCGWMDEPQERCDAASCEGRGARCADGTASAGVGKGGAYRATASVSPMPTLLLCPTQSNAPTK